MREIESAIRYIQNKLKNRHVIFEGAEIQRTALAALRTIEWIESLSKVTDIRPWAILAKFQEFEKEGK